MISNTRRNRLALQTCLYGHEGQLSKGNPRLLYAVHPIQVAIITGEMTSDEDKICAAYLHDFFEEVPPERYDRNRMAREFGSRVVHMVDMLSKDPGIMSWQGSKEAQIAALLGFSDFSEIEEIALADKTDNLTATLNRYGEIGDVCWQVFGGGRAGQLWWFQALRDEVFTQERMTQHTSKHVQQFGELVMQLEQLGGVPLDRAQV